MNEVAILYGYYERERELVECHYRCLVHDNPGVPIIPIVYGAPKWLPETVDVAELENVWIREDEFYLPPAYLPKEGLRHAYCWYFCDRFIWRYLRSRNHVKAQRYIFFEWDTFSNGMSVREFYDPIWDAPLAGSRVYTRETLQFYNWWYPALFQNAGDKARSIVPVGGTLVTREVGHFLANQPWPDFLRRAFVEVGYPTLCAMNGIEPTAFPMDRQTMIFACGDFTGKIRDERGIYHPVYHWLKWHPKEVT